MKKRIMVLEIYFKDTNTLWFIANERFYIQADQVICGPIACLKVMEIMGSWRWVPFKNLEILKEDIGILLWITTTSVSSNTMKVSRWS